MRVGIPGCNDLALFNLFPVLHRYRRSVRDFVTLALATKLVDDRYLSGARYGDKITRMVSNNFDVVQLGDTVRLDLDVVDRCGA